MKQRFRKLVDQYRHRIYTFAYYHLGNQEEAEDVSQDVLLRLWKSWEKIDPDRLPAWITRVTRNACIDAIRKRNRYGAMIVTQENYEIVVQAASAGSGQDAVLEAIDLRTRLEKALSGLEEPYRTVVILREIQEMRYTEISEALDMPLNTVKVHLHRARRMLRDRLRSEDN